jgi:hypothetical protein
MIRRENQQQRVPGPPTTRTMVTNDSGKPTLAHDEDDNSEMSCRPARLRAAVTGDAPEPALESEDGDMFIHSEDDTDY